MADFDAPQFAAGPLATLGYAEEVSFGRVPEDAVLKHARRVSTTLGLTKDSYESEEIRADRATADMRHGIRRANGDVVTELSPGSHADWMEATLGSYWQTPTPVAITSTNLTATFNAATGILTVTAVAFNFVTSQLYVGAPVTFTGANAALNGKLFTVSGHSANTITLIPPAGFTLPGSPVSLTAGTFGVKGGRITLGNISRSFTMERAFTDIGSFIVFTGEKPNTMNVELPATGIARCTYGFMGKDASPLATASIDGVAEITLDAGDLTSLTFNAAAGTITAAGGNFITAGFAAGDRVLISGTGITDPQNRNPRTVINVTATVLTVAEAIQSGGPYTTPFEVTRVGLPDYTAAPNQPVLVAVSGKIIQNGLPIATVTEARFTIDNQMGGSEVVGSNFIPAIMFGNRMRINGGHTVLFDRGGAGEALYNAFDLETDMTIVYRLDMADGTGGITFVFPAAKPSSGNIGDAVPTGIPVAGEFVAKLPDGTQPGVGRLPIYIYDTTITSAAPAPMMAMLGGPEGFAAFSEPEGEPEGEPEDEPEPEGKPEAPAPAASKSKKAESVPA